MKKEWIYAAGGGGGSREPTRTPDNLLSQDYFEIVLALCEGPIKGLVSDTNTLENFYAGDTPLFNIGSNQPNFSDFNVTAYVGGDDNVPLKLRLGGLAANVPVNVELAKDIPVTRTTPALQRGLFDQIEVRINFAYLAKQNNDGIFEATAQFRLEYKAASSPTWLHYENRNPLNITGKTTNGYVKDFIFEVPKINEDYNIRLTKVSPDGVQGVDETVVVLAWESFQTVVRSEPVFPGLAMMHLYGKASNQFSSLPDFSGVYEGMLVKVPVNYNPETRTYDETVPWNGTFKEAYTNNGPWILYNLITNPTYGLARYYKGVTANRFEFYEEAKWCDTPVPDGRGGTQPRFTFNELLADASPGMELLRYVAGSFDAVIYDDGNGVISLRSDRPVSPTQVFTPENVSVEGFSYTFTDVASRFNDITAVFVNPDLDWEEDRRSATIDNTAAIAQNGRIPHEFIAIGCTDANEAVRRANLRYVTSNGEVATVVFTTSRLGLICELLRPILICDPDADWGVSGRIKSVAGNVIQLRDPIFFPDSNPRTMKVQSYSGLVSLTVAPPSTGEVYSLTITAGSFPTGNVPDRTTFTIEDQSALGMAKPFRVLSIEEVEGKPDKVQITALEIAEDKYPIAELGTVYTPSTYAYTTPGEPLLPSAFLLTSPPPIISSDGSILYRIEASWKRPIGANTARYEIDFKHDEDDVWRTEVSYGESAFLSPVRDGQPYTARLYAVSPVGVRSALCLQSQITVVKKSGTLPALTGFAVVMTTSGWEVRWSAPTDIPDFDYVDVRAGPTSSPFNSLPTYARKRESPYNLPWLPAFSFRVHGKAVDTSKNASATAAFADITVLPPDTPILTLSRGFDGMQIAFQDCTTTQPLKDILIRTGPAGSTWDTATDAGSAGANQLLVTVVPSATTITRVYLRARDIANNLSNIAAADIPAAAGDVQELLDILEQGIGPDNLTPGLLSTIELITAPSATPGSVNARVQAEVTNRTLAIQQEVNNRTQAIALSEQNLTTAINQGDTSTLAAARSYTYSKAESDNAIANSINALSASINGPGGTISSAVSQEAGVRAAADGHLGAQWALKVALINAGGTAEIAGIAVAGTSSGTAGSRFDMSFRSNAFFFLPPAGQSNVGYAPLIFYPTPTVVNGLNIAAGLYTRAAFIEYIQADRIDTRGLTVKTLSGSVLLGESVNLDFSRINPSLNWLNTQITVASDGTLLNGSTAQGAIRLSNRVDSSWWAPGVSTTQWPQDGPIVSTIVTDTLPDGVTSGPVWRAYDPYSGAPGSPGSGPGGGFIPGGYNGASNTFRVDRTRTYMFVCYFKRVTGNATFYFGPDNYDAAQLAELNTTVGSALGAYGAIAAASATVENRWYVAVCYVFPHGSTGHTNNGAGIFDTVTGAQLVAGTNFNWRSTSTHAGVKAFQYYSNTVPAETRFASPAAYLCDGGEPALSDLLSAGYGTRIGQAATRATWGGVSGAGKPSDYATRDVVLVGRNADIEGNSVRKSINTLAWDADAYSNESYVGGAYASVTVGETNTNRMFGLNTDPLTDGSYTSLDRAVYMQDNGQLSIFEGGGPVMSPIPYATGDELTVSYDGSFFRYLQNGTVVYAAAATVTGRLFFDSSLYTPNSTLKNIRFGPLTSNNWAAVGGANKPQDNATVGAPVGTLVGSTLAENVESTAGAQAKANAAQAAAIVAANIGLAGKLSKDIADILTAPITLSSSGAIQVGNTTNGVILAPTGLVGYKTGNISFSLDNSGSLYLRGANAGVVVQNAAPVITGSTTISHEQAFASHVGNGFAVRAGCVGTLQLYLNTTSARVLNVSCRMLARNATTLEEIYCPVKAFTFAATGGSPWFGTGDALYQIPIDFSWLYSGSYWTVTKNLDPGLAGIPGAPSLVANFLGATGTWTISLLVVVDCVVPGSGAAAASIAHARLSLGGWVHDMPGILQSSSPPVPGYV